MECSGSRAPERGWERAVAVLAAPSLSADGLAASSVRD